MVVDADDLAVMATMTEDEKRAVVKRLRKLQEKQERERRVSDLVSCDFNDMNCTCPSACAATVFYSALCGL